MKVCSEPFKNMEIVESGDVFFCCAQNLAYKPIGNIYQNTFEEIWNSEEAQKLRKEILNNCYDGCNTTDCYGYSHQDDMFIEPDETMRVEMNKFPENIKLMHDCECNASCIICRDKIIRQTEENLEKLDNNIDSIYIPMLKDAKIINLNASGDPFASRHNSKLIKRICEIYPDVKFDFLTNAILATPEKLNTLGVTDKINKMIVSIHATTQKTYEKIVLNGNFDKASENITFFSSLLKSNKIAGLDMCFVVSSLNYKEMPSFIEWCKKLDASCFFWEYRRQGFYVNENYDDIAIHLESHPEHNEFIKVLKNLDIKGLKNYPLHPVLHNLREQ